MRALGKGSVAEIVRVGLDIAWAVLWIAAAVLVLMAGAFALDFTGVLDLGRFFSPDSGLHLSLDDNALVLPPGAPTWPLFVSAILIGAAAITGGLVIVWRLRKLFDSFCSSQPFAKENADHLRAIWITMLAMEIARYLLLLMTVGLFALNNSQSGTQEANVQFHVDLSTWASIAILMVLAEVFREGARMRDEQELTI